MYTGELGDILASILQRAADVTAKLSDRAHVSRQVIHLVLHLTKICFHLKRKRLNEKEGYYIYRLPEATLTL